MKIQGTNNNSSNVSQAFWVGVGSFSTFTVSLISAAILSRYLSKSEYGTYRQILYVYNTLQIVFTAGLPRVFSYFLPRYSLSQGKEVVFRLSKILFLTGFAFSIFLFVLSNPISNLLRNDELAIGLKFFSLVPVFLLPTLGIESIFATYKKTRYYALYNVITRVILLICSVLPVIIFAGGYITAVKGWALSSIITFFIAYFFKGIPFKGVKLQKSGLKLKEILIYSLPLVAAAIGGTIYRAANQFYISRYFGEEVFAEFANGFIEIPFVTMITGATSVVLMPVFAKMIHEKTDISQVTNLWRSALQKSAILIYPIVIYFLFYSNEVVTIVYSEAYAKSSQYFSIAMTLNFFNIIIFAPLLLALGEVRFYARLHYGLAISTWVVGFIVVRIFETPVSVAISYVIIAICGMVVPIQYSARKMGTSFLSLFPIDRFIIIAIHSLSSMYAVNFIMRRVFPDLADLLFIFISGVGYLVVLLLTSRFFKINYFSIIKPMFRNNRMNN